MKIAYFEISVQLACEVFTEKKCPSRVARELGEVRFSRFTKSSVRVKRKRHQPNFDNRKLILCCKLLYDFLIKIKTKFFLRWIEWLKVSAPAECNAFSMRSLLRRNRDAGAIFYSVWTFCQSPSHSVGLSRSVLICVRVWIQAHWYLFKQVRCFSLQIEAIHFICGCFKATLSQYFSFHLVSIRFVWLRSISFPRRNGELRSQVQSEILEKSS